MTRKTSSSKQCSRCGLVKRNSSFTGPRGRLCATCRKLSKKTSSDKAHRSRQQKYGYLDGEYDKLLAAQGGACAICNGKRKYRLDSDHDHDTGMLRGLLCRNCNRKLLTAARNNATILRAAADYLDDPPAQRILGERYYDDDANGGSAQALRIQRFRDA